MLGGLGLAFLTLPSPPFQGTAHLPAAPGQEELELLGVYEVGLLRRHGFLGCEGAATLRRDLSALMGAPPGMEAQLGRGRWTCPQPWGLMGSSSYFAQTGQGKGQRSQGRP